MTSINGSSSDAGRDDEVQSGRLHRWLPGVVVLLLIAAYFLQNCSAQMVEGAEGLEISRWKVRRWLSQQHCRWHFCRECAGSTRPVMRTVPTEGDGCTTAS